ncbi:hypothetical protein EXIGLDRAFT_836555 [Exidia glandulosa HHB12029]|uniref:Uncharacterized protein n=1 Tax=Exidia glandulosa HHB12029 TaxID=1314781 RepID=A0A165HP82_EXIGL|nr:hypothetical protein EXIGLDRAFT_836555 [Exidia glandulosa HHB12029]
MALDGASLLAFILESFGYGIFFVLFIGCMYVLVAKPLKASPGARPKILVPLVVASLVFFVVITAHWICNAVRVMEAFVIKRDDPGPLLYYANFADPKYLLKVVLWSIEAVTADLVMVYRAYVVWGRRVSIIAVPSLMVLVAAVSAGVLIYQFSILELGVDIFVSECGRWIVTCFSMMLAFPKNKHHLHRHVFEILTTSRNIGHRLGSSGLGPIVQVVVESAALYAAAVATTLFLYIGRSNGQFITLEILSPMTASTPLLPPVAGTEINDMSHRASSLAWSSSALEWASMQTARKVKDTTAALRGAGTKARDTAVGCMARPV